MNRARSITVQIDSLFGAKMFQAYLFITVMDKDAESISDYQLRGMRFIDPAKLQRVLSILAQRGWEQQPVRFDGDVHAPHIEIAFERKEQFAVTSVCREDFEAIGFNAGTLTDDMMKLVARRLGEKTTAETNDYFLNLIEIANDLELPILKAESER